MRKEQKDKTDIDWLNSIKPKLNMLGYKIIKSTDYFALYTNNIHSRDYRLILNINNKPVIKDNLTFNSFRSSNHFLIIKSDGSLWSQLEGIFVRNNQNNLLENIPNYKPITVYCTGDIRLYSTIIPDEQRVLVAKTLDENQIILFNYKGKRKIIYNININSRKEIWCTVKNTLFQKYTGQYYEIHTEYSSVQPQKFVMSINDNLDILKFNKDSLKYGNTLEYKDI